ncbi:MAG: hypothetical protein ACRD21_17960, partial [Vicinamibacteria bacterium]
AGPEVSMLREPGGKTAQFNWTGVLADNVTATSGFGWNDFRLHQLFRDDSTVHTRDLVTQRRFGNPGGGGRDSTGINWDYNASLSWFIPDAAGRHDVKLGFEYTHSPFDWGFTEIEDHQLRVANGVPEQVVISNTPVDAKWLQHYTSVYVQDSWTIQDRLTLNLGVRFDRIDAITPEQSSGGGNFANTQLAEEFPRLNRTTYAEQDLWAWNSMGPRLAASYEIGETGRTVLRGGYGRIYHHLNSQQVWSVNPNFPSNITFRWNDSDGDAQFQLDEQGTLLSVSGGGRVGVDPDLRHPFSDEFTVGVSHEPVTDLGVSASFIYREDKDLNATINIGVPFDSYTPVEVPDPEGGTLTVFAQDPATFGQDQLLLTNPDRHGFLANREFKALELVANKRLSDRWQFVGSLVISDMEVTVPADASGGAIGSTFNNPNANLNTRGKDTLNQKYLVKLQGTYEAPYGILLSGLYRYGSGFPYTRDLVVRGLPQGTITVFAEPRGSRETDDYNWIDFRVEKTFDLQATRLGVMVDLFNLTNSATVLREGTRTGINLGQPQIVKTPRIARFGVRFTW